MSWYKARMSGNGQGLVIEQDTGRDVAVTYDEKDAALVAAAPELLDALKGLFEHCAMIHRVWGDGSNQKEADAAIAAGKAAIAKAEGRE